MQVGMELVDADWRRWLVCSVRRTGRAGSLLFHVLPFLAAPQSRIEHELKPMTALSLDEVRRRASAAMRLTQRTITKVMNAKPKSSRYWRR
jgi:hypothetical protein